MERQVIKMEKREAQGSRSARRARLQGKLPGVVYGQGKAGIPVELDLRELRKSLFGKLAHAVLLDLQGFDEVKGKMALLREVQRAPVSGEPMHADFLELQPGQKIQLKVPVHLFGKAKGSVKGGVVKQTLREVEITCTPETIPYSIDADIAPLDIGDVLHLKDVKLPEGVALVGTLSPAVVTIVPPKGKAAAAAPAA